MYIDGYYLVRVEDEDGNITAEIAYRDSEWGIEDEVWFYVGDDVPREEPFEVVKQLHVIDLL